MQSFARVSLSGVYAGVFLFYCYLLLFVYLFFLGGGGLGEMFAFRVI